MCRVKYTHSNRTEQAPIKCIHLQVELEVELTLMVVVDVEVIMSQESLLRSSILPYQGDWTGHSGQPGPSRQSYPEVRYPQKPLHRH